MKDIFCVYRDWDYGSFDIIAFETRKEAEEFCLFNPDYQEYPTSIMNLKDAKAIFPHIKDLTL